MVPPSAGDTVPPVRCISARTHAWHREAYSSSYISHNNAYHVFTLTGATINTTTMRDQLCCDGCFLHCGQLSPRAVWPRVRTQIQHSPRGPFTVYSFQANEGFLNEGERRGGAAGGRGIDDANSKRGHTCSPSPAGSPANFFKPKGARVIPNSLSRTDPALARHSWRALSTSPFIVPYFQPFVSYPSP